MHGCPHPIPRVIRLSWRKLAQARLESARTGVLIVNLPKTGSFEVGGGGAGDGFDVYMARFIKVQIMAAVRLCLLFFTLLVWCSAKRGGNEVLVPN